MSMSAQMRDAMLSPTIAIRMKILLLLRLGIFFSVSVRDWRIFSEIARFSESVNSLLAVNNFPRPGIGRLRMPFLQDSQMSAINPTAPSSIKK